jgi:hypothetical protein
VVHKKHKIYPASYEMKEKTGQCRFLLESTSLLLLLLLLILHEPTKKHLFKKGEGEDFFLLIFILFLHKSQRQNKINGKGDTLI